VGGDGDQARFEALVVPYLADAFALARWISGNRADAEDIVQDACLRAFRGIGGYNGGSPRAWLLTIVRRTAYSWLEKYRTPMLYAVDDLDAKSRQEAELGGNSYTSPETPEAELIAKADAKDLEVAIAALPVEFRETLVLRDIQGLDYREISQVMATPIGTVMSRLSRARRRLIDTIGADRS
jgi:RNA polymerase sigma-70 factor (ECF subfamily)